MDSARLVADALTGLRVFLGAGIAWLALSKGESGFTAVAAMLVLAWLSDILDGAAARRSKYASPSWIGRHDLETDIWVSLAILFYLGQSRFISAWVPIIYLLACTLAIALIGYGRSLGMLIQAPIYAGFIWIAWHHRPAAAVAMLGWIVLAILLTWPRFPRQVIPDFLESISLWGKHRQS